MKEQPGRFQVRAGIDGGQPYIEIVDNLAIMVMRFDPALALEIAQMMQSAVFAAMSEQVRRMAQKIHHPAIMVTKN